MILLFAKVLKPSEQCVGLVIGAYFFASVTAVPEAVTMSMLP